MCFFHLILLITFFPHILHGVLIEAPVMGLARSSEYCAAMELEMWKLSQEETFANKMKAKEAEYLHRLGEEWKKREEERQKVFTQKVYVLLDTHTCMYVYNISVCIYMYIHVHVHVYQQWCVSFVLCICFVVLY